MKDLDSIKGFLPPTPRNWDKSARDTDGGRGSLPQCLARPPLSTVEMARRTLPAALRTPSTAWSLDSQPAPMGIPQAGQSASCSCG